MKNTGLWVGLGIGALAIAGIAMASGGTSRTPKSNNALYVEPGGRFRVVTGSQRSASFFVETASNGVYTVVQENGVPVSFPTYADAVAAGYAIVNIPAPDIIPSASGPNANVFSDITVPQANYLFGDPAFYPGIIMIAGPRHTPDFNTAAASLANAADDRPGINVAIVTQDQVQATAQKLGVQAFPTDPDIVFMLASVRRPGSISLFPYRDAGPLDDMQKSLKIGSTIANAVEALQ